MLPKIHLIIKKDGSLYNPRFIFKQDLNTDNIFFKSHNDEDWIVHIFRDKLADLYQCVIINKHTKNNFKLNKLFTFEYETDFDFIQDED